MNPAASTPGAVGEASGSTPGPVPTHVRWWQHGVVRISAGLLTVLALLVPPLFFPLAGPWRLGITGVNYLEVTPGNINVYVGLLLLPFMGQVSYRKRDILIVVLVPLYGQFVAGRMVSRMLSLPRRDWTPRPDELDRAVRIPSARGAYLLRPTFADAEHLRARWCVNPSHQHPYDSWSTEQIGCTQRRPIVP